VKVVIVHFGVVDGVEEVLHVVEHHPNNVVAAFKGAPIVSYGACTPTSGPEGDKACYNQNIEVPHAAKIFYCCLNTI
jgi:hypothetical protein